MLELVLRRLRKRAAVARAMAVLLIAVFSWPAFGGVPCCTDALAAASAGEVGRAKDDCCPGDAQSNDTEDGAPCPCPFPCAPGCAGQLGRVLVQAHAMGIAAPGQARAEPFRSAVAMHSEPDPRDILHVPKPSVV
jgi:hypothetical protein